MRIIARLLVALSLASTAGVASAKDAPAALAAAERDPAIERTVRVVLRQLEIETSIELGRIAPTTGGGGLLGTLVISAMDDRREILSSSAGQRAESAAAPLREALEGFDADGLALATARAGLGQVAWFRPSDVALARDDSAEGLRTLASSAGGRQVALISLRYDLSPDFTQIRVFADLSLARPGGRFDPFYEQRMVSVVQLNERSYDAHENVARWSANGGEAARTALTRGFAAIERLIPLALDLSAAEAAGLADRNREKAFAAGLYGPLIARGEGEAGGVLIWADGLVQVQGIEAPAGLR